MPVTPIQRLVDVMRALWRGIVRPRSAERTRGVVTEDEMMALRRELQRRLLEKMK